MIQICTLKSLEFINPCYYITDDLKIINIDTNHKKSIWVNKRGYPTVSLEYGHGKHKNIAMHKIVALAYIDNRDRYELIEHLDDNPMNYNPSNLKFSNKSDNGKRAFINGHRNRIEKRFILILKHGMIKGTIKEISNSTDIPIQTLYDHLYNYHEKSKHGILAIIEI